jgi:hypothetical protein
MKVLRVLTLTTVCFLMSYAKLAVAQTCNSNIIANAPDSRYILNSNGTVLDRKTGLSWMRCSLGQVWNGIYSVCVGSPQIYVWENALQIAEGKTFAGFSDWRLPNIKELQSLVQNNCSNPAINLTAFPGTPDGSSFWSSSPTTGENDSAWLVVTSGGYSTSYAKWFSLSVRLVRSGQ